MPKSILDTMTAIVGRYTKGLTKLGFTCVKPEGAFYLWLKSPEEDERQFVEKAKHAAPLSSLTDGVHIHNLRCPSEEAYQRVCEDLKQLGILYIQGGNPVNSPFRVDKLP